jgi:hypothetical protein
MAKSRTTGVLSALALGVGITAAALPAAATDQPDPKVTTNGSTRTITALGHATSGDYKPVDGPQAPKPPTTAPKPGDVFTFADDLRQGGLKIGTDSGTCTFVAGAEATCEATTTFADGTLVGKGTRRQITGSYDVPITSGTGAYRGATGTVHVVPVAGTNDRESNITFTYTPAQQSGSDTSNGAASSPANGAAGTGAGTGAGNGAAGTGAKAPSQVSRVPTGGAATGGGSTAGLQHGWLFALAALAGLGGTATLALGRRR